MSTVLEKMADGITALCKGISASYTYTSPPYVWLPIHTCRTSIAYYAMILQGVNVLKK